MKLDLTKPVCLNNEEKTPVTIFTTKAEGAYPLVGQPKGDIVTVWTIDGLYTVSGSCPNKNLINVPEKRTVEFWVNMYPPDVGFVNRSAHNSKEAAEKAALKNRIACLHIVREFTVGEGLN